MKNQASNSKLQPCFRLGEVYLVDDLIANMQIAPKTFEAWVRQGLPVFRPSTRSRYVLTDDLIRVWAEMADRTD